MFEEIHGDTGGNTKIKTVDLLALTKNNGLSEIGEVGGKSGCFITENKRVGFWSRGKVFGGETARVKHKSKVLARKGFGVGVESWKRLNIEMEKGTHASAYDFGVKKINGWFDDGEIIEVHGGSGTNNGAKIASVRRIDKNKMIGSSV